MKLYSHITSIVQISHIYLANEKYKDIPNCSVVKTLPSCTGVWVWSLLAWCKELIHLKRPWCWERLKAGGEGDDRGWDGWMASSTQWTWVWVNSRSWWWTGRPGVLRFMGSQSQTQLWLNWTETRPWTRHWNFLALHCISVGWDAYSPCLYTGEQWSVSLKNKKEIYGNGRLPRTVLSTL